MAYYVEALDSSGIKKESELKALPVKTCETFPTIIVKSFVQQEIQPDFWIISAQVYWLGIEKLTVRSQFLSELTKIFFNGGEALVSHFERGCL